jgi:hypothetical protein
MLQVSQAGRELGEPQVQEPDVLLRLAQIIEQLDLAHEHLQHGDPNNARFGLMLTDNALEITLHRLAQDEDHNARGMAWKIGYRHPHATALNAALGQDFGAKVRLAEALGLVSAEEAGTIRIGHTFRNEVYHVGVQHEHILHDVAIFYFRVASEVISRIKPRFFGWGSGDRLPERAKKYFKGHTSFPAQPGDYARACLDLAARSGHDRTKLIAAMAGHMAKVVDDQDESIDFLATNAQSQTSRKAVVVDTQAWAIAFSDEGRAFLASLAVVPKTAFARVAEISKAYPRLVRSDPIPRWRTRALAVAREQNPHRALELYRSFMDQTQQLRGWIDESARGLDEHIQNEIDRMRGK